MYSSNSSSNNSSISHILNNHFFINNSNHSNLQQPNNANSVCVQRQYCPKCRNYKIGPLSFGLCSDCGDTNSKIKKLRTPDKLIEISAKVVALNYPFQVVENRYERIPEPVQQRIIFWSFPRNERDICMYSSLNSEEQKVPFNKGLRLLDNKSVDNVLQVGFHLSGTVTVKPNTLFQPGDQEKKHRVSITFDRCKITSVTCSCDTKDIFWCTHVVALAIYRIRYASEVKLRVPISETLLQLSRCQLQKLVQYLISDHHTEILPTAQSLADEMLVRNSELNAVHGAPDPTAGAAAEQENCWHLDEQQVTKQVTHFLQQDNFHQVNKQINALFGKVKEMLKARDSNASRMLRLITEQFLTDRRLIAWRNQGAMADKFRQLWDQLVELWVYIALNPHATMFERKNISDLLYKFDQNQNCPLEDSNYKLGPSPLKRKLTSSGQVSDDDDENGVASGDDLMDGVRYNEDDQLDDNNNYNYNESRRNRSQAKNRRKKKRSTPRTIFQRALEGSHLKWDDRHLRFILGEKLTTENESSKSISFRSSNSDYSSSSYANNSSSSLFNSQGYPLWNEPIPVACARVEALRCHGYQMAALRLAVAIVRSMKKQQRDSMNIQANQNICSSSGVSRDPIYYNTEGWIGNPLDSISTLFDTLAEASLTPESKPLEYYYGMFLGDFNNNKYSMNSNIPSSAPLEVSIPSLFPEDFSALVNHQRNLSSNSQNNSNPNSLIHEKPRYLHVVVNGSKDNSETYISLALEAALIGLGQQRLMPTSEYLQVKAIKQEERLIAKLNDIDLDPVLIGVLRNQVVLLLDGGPYSGFGLGIHPESVPMHTFARYLFTALLTYDSELAYLVGLRAMRLPILEGYYNLSEDLNNNNLSSNQNLRRNAGGVNNSYNYYVNYNNNIYAAASSGNGNHSNNNNRSMYSRPGWHRWYVLENIEQQQCQLATTMICAAKNNFSKLKSIQKAAQRHIHTSTHLFKLAQDAFRLAIPNDNCNNVISGNGSNGTNSSSLLPSNSVNNLSSHQQLPYIRHQHNVSNNAIHNHHNLPNNNSNASGFNFANLSLTIASAFQLPSLNNLNTNQTMKSSSINSQNTTSHLLEVAFELGLQVVRMTFSNPDNKRKEIVKWIVTCATEIGFQALVNLMQSWCTLFTPFEAVHPVATYIMSPAVLSKINLTMSQQEELSNAARLLAIQCTKEDASNCSLHALSLCESEQYAFESCYNIVIESGHNNKMSFGQLINVAKYIENRGYLEWAFELSQLAMKNVQIAYNGETHPSISDIHWTCTLAQNLGKEQLGSLVPILIKNIQCAQVLSDIIRLCMGTLNYTNRQNHQSNIGCPQTNSNSNNQFNGYSCLNLNGNPLTLSGTSFSSNSNRRHHHHLHHHNNSNNLSCKLLNIEKNPLKDLLNAAIDAYFNTTHNKLSSISPRHYGDFVEFLAKARETYLLAKDGANQFNSLIDNIKNSYKGKKKLMSTIKSRFG